LSDELYPDTSPLSPEPVIFITSPGADPSQELEEFAARTVGLARFRQLAMGQGQSESALAMLREAARAGDWVCFKNLHLVVTWLHVLEKEVHGLEAHPDFRLWLTRWVCVSKTRWTPSSNQLGL
jgi:dynein heavy chain 2